jgi:uncharacterized membrane protein YdbT with pleckstrin-like domain
VPDLTIQPTAKFLKAGTVLIALVFLALEIAYFTSWRDKEFLSPLPLVAPLLFLWPGAHWLRRRSTRAYITGDRLRYEVGLMSKSTRTIQLSNIQDVRVNQRLMQRLLNIGDLWLETAGQSSRLEIPNIDHPQDIADHLLNRVQGGSGTAAV